MRQNILSATCRLRLNDLKAGKVRKKSCLVRQKWPKLQREGIETRIAGPGFRISMGANSRKFYSKLGAKASRTKAWRQVKWRAKRKVGGHAPRPGATVKKGGQKQGTRNGGEKGGRRPIPIKADA